MTFKFEMGEVVDIVGGFVTNATVMGRSENDVLGITYKLGIPMNDKEHIELTMMHERWLVGRKKEGFVNCTVTGDGESHNL